jgi:hypothetical protein
MESKKDVAFGGLHGVYFGWIKRFLLGVEQLSDREQ